MKLKTLALLAILLLFGAPLLAQFEHPDLKSGKKQVLTMLMMPVQVQITKASMHGGEPMIEESLQVQKSLTPVLGNVLQKQGYSVDQEALTPLVLEKDPDLRYTVDDLQKKFDDVLQQMMRKSKDVRKARFTLGDEVAKLPAGEKVDALLFVRANGEVKTGGKKAFGWIVSGDVWDIVTMHIGVVDSRSGEVLYFAKPTMLKNLAKDPAETAGGVEKAFKNFVKASPAPSMASKPKEAAPAQPQAGAEVNVPSIGDQNAEVKSETKPQVKPDSVLPATAKPSQPEATTPETGTVPDAPPKPPSASTSNPPK